MPLLVFSIKDDHEGKFEKGKNSKLFHIINKS